MTPCLWYASSFEIYLESCLNFCFAVHVQFNCPKEKMSYFSKKQRSQIATSLKLVGLKFLVSLIVV
jgi:hypothetical protein